MLLEISNLLLITLFMMKINFFFYEENGMDQIQVQYLGGQYSKPSPLCKL